MEEKRYYCVTTRRFTLRCGHEDWLRQTQILYNEVLSFYYNLFLRMEEESPGRLSGQSAQQVLRELEVCTIVGRDKTPVPWPLPWEKLPLYFRRAAINGASSVARSYLGRVRSGIPTGKAQHFQKGVTFYKGMYRELTQNRVSLKVFNGNGWSWIACRLSGNKLPLEAEILSPSVTLNAQGASLLVPVREKVVDGRKAQVRMKDKTKICSIQFTNEEAFAVGVVLDEEGNQTGVHFFKGGRSYRHRCRKVLEKIRASESSMGLEGIVQIPVNQSREETAKGVIYEKVNKKYWMKLKHISEYYAHGVSREIVEYCVGEQAGILVLPSYDQKFTKYVMQKAGNWSPLHLSRRIRELIQYKAWKEGIIVLEVNSGGTSSYCAQCGALVKKKEDSYECPNGHRGNRQMNTARNLGRKCLKSFGKEIS